MPQQRLQDLLSSLHDSLERGEELDAETLAMLRTVSDDIDRLIQTDQPESQEDVSPVETLEQLVEQFEGRHPRAAGIVRQIIQTLSDIGI